MRTSLIYSTDEVEEKPPIVVPSVVSSSPLFGCWDPEHLVHCRDQRPWAPLRSGHLVHRRHTCSGHWLALSEHRRVAQKSQGNSNSSLVTHPTQANAVAFVQASIDSPVLGTEV